MGLLIVPVVQGPSYFGFGLFLFQAHTVAENHRGPGFGFPLLSVGMAERVPFILKSRGGSGYGRLYLAKPESDKT